MTPRCYESSRCGDTKTLQEGLKRYKGPKATEVNMNDHSSYIGTKKKLISASKSILDCRNIRSAVGCQTGIGHLRPAIKG